MTYIKYVYMSKSRWDKGKKINEVQINYFKLAQLINYIDSAP